MSITRDTVEFIWEEIATEDTLPGYARRKVMNASATVVGCKIYILGQLGRRDTEEPNVSSICYFDISRKAWEWVDTTGPWFDLHKVVLVEDCLYSFGGEEYNYRLRDPDPWKFDLVEMSWQATKSIGWKPKHRVKASVDYMEEANIIVIFGGGVGVGEDDVDELLLYDFVKSTWKVAKCSGQVPTPRHRHASCSAGLDLFVYGGILDRIRVKDLYIGRFDLRRQSFRWTQMSMYGNNAIPTASPSMNYAAGKLFIFGGFDASDVDTNDFNIFDVTERTWHRLANNSEYKLHGDTLPNSTHCAVSRYEGIYMLGGYGRGFPGIEVFKPVDSA